MTLKIATCGQIAILALGFAGAVSATQAQTVVKSVSGTQSQAQGSKVGMRIVADPLPQSRPSTIVLKSGPDSPLQAHPQTLAQSSGGAAAEVGQEDQNLIISPGGLLRRELPATMGSVIIGDPNILDVLPTTEKAIYLLGKKTGDTDIVVLGENGRIVFQANVLVDVPRDPRISDVSIYNGQKLSNFTSYSCFTGGSCAVSMFNEIRKENLPRGYSNNSNSSTFKDTTEPNGEGGGGGSRPAPTQTIPIAPPPQ